MLKTNNNIIDDYEYIWVVYIIFFQLILLIKVKNNYIII